MELDHPLPPEEVRARLVDNLNFRKRIAFEFGDRNVTIQPRDLEFIATVPGFSLPVTVFQNDKLKWIDTAIIIRTRYCFISGLATVRVKAERRILAISPTKSRSETRATVVSQNSEPLAGAVLAFIARRQQRENELLRSADTAPLPYESALAEVRAAAARIDALVDAQAGVDPAVTAAVAELRAFRGQIQAATESIGTALRERAAARQVLEAAAVRLARAAEAADQALTAPPPEREVDIGALLSAAVVFAPVVIVAAAWLWKRLK